MMVDFKKKIILAPMAGVNDLCFRLLCRKYGADITFSQMFDVSEIEKFNEKDFSELDKPIGIQLIGNVNDNWEKAVKRVEKFADFIDINLGCPEKEKLAKRSGSYLLQFPEQISKIIKKIKNSTTKPITAKIRSGWKNINFLEIIKIIEKENISAVTIHPRLANQGYKGKADIELIKIAKENSNLIIIGNGDITLPGHAKSMFEKTKCDSIMIGRMAVKNPFIFNQIKELLEKGSNSSKKINFKKIILDYIEIYEKNSKDKKINLFKEHICWFLSNHSNANEIKKEIRELNSVEEIKNKIIKL